MNELNEFMDNLESALIATIQTFKEGMTEEGARNVLAKVGTRITFGKETFDAVYKKEINDQVKK